MPKVMMIGKVSKLRGPTRRAGSFKGSLGAVVLEGSRAQSRRYGMGNIAGSPAQHRQAYAALMDEAALSLKAAKEMKSCAGRTNEALHVIRNAAEALREEGWTGPSRSTNASRMIVEAEGMIRACVSRSASAGMSGVRRRRSR